MRVLAFSDHLSTASSGGAERVAAEIYRRMAAEHDVDLTVVTVLRPGHRPLDIPRVRVVAVPGTDLSALAGAEMLLAPGLRRRVVSLAQQVCPDVLHANGLHFHGTAAAAGLARRTGTPLVTTAHLGDLSALSRRLRAAGTGWDHTVGRYVVRASRTMVAVSRAVAEHLASLGARPESTVVALNGVDHSIFSTVGRPPIGSGGPLRAVFVGRLIDNKGPDVALDAVARARAAGRDVTLTVLGDGPLRETLRTSARRHGLGSAVTFAGQVGQAGQVAGYLRDADVLLRPSYTEGLPLAVLEAMACGVPVVCSTVPGNTEVVVDDVNGVHTPPGGVVAVAAALSALHDDRPRLRRLAAAAASTAARYSWEHSAAVHLAALRSAAATTRLAASSAEPLAKGQPA